jgi:hypothetical protein
MRPFYACGSADHHLSRRRFLGTAAGMLGLGALADPAIGARLRREQKRVLLIFMHGGLSQLESWDPKPGTDTGGPFLAVPTSVPAFTSPNCCRTPPRRCTAWPWCAASTRPRTSTAAAPT